MTPAEKLTDLRNKLAASQRMGLNTRVKAIETEIAKLERAND